MGCFVKVESLSQFCSEDTGVGGGTLVSYVESLLIFYKKLIDSCQSGR